jgi:DNA-binding GntR family transcriptional regulator
MARANEIAYDYIKNRIIDGTLRPAQRLIEAQLASEIGVSRNTIKKVLLQLEQDRLVTIQDNKGAMVQSLTVGEIQEYYEIRKVLEVIVVRSAIEFISAKDLQKMQDVYAEMCELNANGDFESYSKGNKQLHEIIYQASCKPIAVEMIRGIKQQLIRFQFRTMVVPGRAEQSVEEHKMLVSAFAKRDKDAATIAIQNHMDNVSATITKYKALFF